METIYGAAALQATQDFTAFQVGGGLIARIPSTFTFVTQFFGYTLAMLVPSYAVGRTDASRRWRWFAWWTLTMLAVTSFLSGARSAFVFVPLLLGLIYGLDCGFKGVLRGLLYLTGMLLAALSVSRVAAAFLVRYIYELFGEYAVNTAYGGLVQAFLTGPLGKGTGTNTGPARYAFEDPEGFVAIQNYYAKVVYELGIPGLLLLCTLFGVLIWQGLRWRRRLTDPALRTCSAALTAFLITVALNSFKGWLVDLDPVNVYFWVFAGVLAKLPYLERSASKPVQNLVRNEQTP